MKGGNIKKLKNNDYNQSYNITDSEYKKTHNGRFYGAF